MVVVLPVPLTPTTSTTGRRLLVALGVQGAVQGRVDQGEQLLAQQGAQFLGGAGAEHLHPGAQPLDELLGRGHADVGGDEDVLDLLPGVLVQLLPGQQGEQALAQGVLRAGEPGAQPDQPARRGLGLLDDGRLGELHLLQGLGGGGRAGQRDLLDGPAGLLPRGLGLVPDVRFGGRLGDRRGARRRGRQLLLLPAAAADHQPAGPEDHDQGDDDDKDHGFHNPLSIPAHAVRPAAFGTPGPGVGAANRPDPPPPAASARFLRGFALRLLDEAQDEGVRRFLAEAHGERVRRSPACRPAAAG